MRAISYHQYGSPDVLQLGDVDRPGVGEGDVLVRVRAASVHVGDCIMLRGVPWLARLGTGIFAPKNPIPGSDIAGVVESVGTNVKRLQPGDEVFGSSAGAFAEYSCAPADSFVLKPENLTFQEAAAVPTSALAALHALRDVGRVQAGQNVLINGASGGVGTFAVQIASSLGAQVTGVCGPTNVDMVRGLGAHQVIDYKQEDFTRRGESYDLILDNVENRSLSDCRRALAPRGTLILNSGTGAKGFGLLVRLVRPLLLSPFTRQSLRRFLSMPSHDDLLALKELLESGALKPVIDRSFALEETPEAFRHVETGHTRGKVVIVLA